MQFGKGLVSQEIKKFFQKFPFLVLWDQRLICHRNSNLSRRAWDQLDLELGIDEEYPLARRKQIWKSKRDYFVSAVNAANLRKWIYAEYGWKIENNEMKIIIFSVH